jgi:hypothetical protein
MAPAKRRSWTPAAADLLKGSGLARPGISGPGTGGRDGQCHDRAVDIARSENARRRRESGAARPAHAGDTVEESDAERQAISLAYFGGYSYVNVASVLGVPDGTVKSRIRSGLARLRCAVIEAGIDPRMANNAASTRTDSAQSPARL